MKYLDKIVVIGLIIFFTIWFIFVIISIQKEYYNLEELQNIEKRIDSLETRIDSLENKEIKINLYIENEKIEYEYTNSD